MANDHSPGINKRYFVVVTVLTFVLPILCTAAEILMKEHAPLSFHLFSKWFIFSAAGLRLFIAGIKQSTDPAFTAKEIFHLSNTDSSPIVRELGFANICFGLIAIVSLFIPSWRVVSAFASGLYYGLAALQHFIKKPVGANERFALLTDAIIFLLLLIYIITML